MRGFRQFGHFVRDGGQTVLLHPYKVFELGGQLSFLLEVKEVEFRLDVVQHCLYLTAELLFSGGEIRFTGAGRILDAFKFDLSRERNNVLSHSVCRFTKLREVKQDVSFRQIY